jgi:hypothetical protein
MLFGERFFDKVRLANIFARVAGKMGARSLPDTEN